jgi:membrane protein YdbS with pleckstrin-like domain
MWPAVCLVIFLPIAVAALANASPDNARGTAWGLWFLLNLPLIGLVCAAVMQYTSDFHITNRRLFTKVGVISRLTNEILLSKIETVTVNQGPIARMFDCGDVFLSGTGNAIKPICTISAPTTFRTYLTKAIAGEDIPSVRQHVSDEKKREATTIIIISIILWFVFTLFAIFYSPSISVSSATISQPANRETSQDPQPSENENFSGQYERSAMADGSEPLGIASLHLVEFDKGQYNFELNSTYERYSSAADGILKLSNSKAVFKSEDNDGTITFSFTMGASGPVVDVVAEPPVAFGSTNCDLSGLYVLGSDRTQDPEPSPKPSPKLSPTPSPRETLEPETFRDPDGQFEFNLPAGLFKLDSSSDQGAKGIYLNSQDGRAVIEASGAATSFSDSTSAMDSEISTHDDWEITMKKKGPGWFALSGYLGDKIFYKKTLVEGNFQRSVIIYYPKADKLSYDSAVEMMAASFR